MISKELCEEIWNCHREIEAGNKLLKEVKEIVAENEKNKHINTTPEKLKDVFGRGRDLELGIPSGDCAKRLLRVSYALAIPIIKSHIAEKTRTLVELNEMAKLVFEE